MNIHEYRSEIEKRKDPYKCWIRENESWRGESVPAGLVRDFRDSYELRYEPGYVKDPDVEERFALYASRGDYDLIYCDEDVISENHRTDPYFKPDYSPDTLESFGYMGGLIAVNKKFIHSEQSGERAVPEKVCHIPEVLYHSKGYKDYEYTGNSSDDEIFVDRSDDIISVIILTKDHPDILRKCIFSIMKNEDTEHTEIIVTDNGSSHKSAAVNRRLAEESGCIYRFDPSPFNYSLLCNEAAGVSSGKFLVFLNDDVVSYTPGAMRKMCRKAAEGHVGAVGIKLLYPDSEKIQHCGITLLESGPSHRLCGWDDTKIYAHGYNRHDIDVLAVTGACLCIQRDKFDAAGGFDTELPVAYNDVDLCMRLYEKGLYNVCMNSMKMYHHESATRADDVSSRDRYDRLLSYRRYFENRHHELIEKGDPFDSINYTRTDYALRPGVSESWEKSGVISVYMTVDPDSIKKCDIRQSVDVCGHRFQDAYGNSDFYEIRGWVLFHRHDTLRYKKGVLLERNGEYILFRCPDMYREDTAEAFPKERHAGMSGFIARIDSRVLERDALYTVQPVLIRGRNKIYKGEDACQIRTI